MTGPNVRERILPRLIEDEMRESFLDYSMSVIVQRALPDVRDGLKPVHRRILYAMHELGLVPGRPYKKSATVVGDVLGKYHPHGDMSVYDALVRMVQDLRRFIKGPDFPTGGIIYGKEGIKECYEKGRGRITVRARAVIEEKESTGRHQVVVTEIPYQVNKTVLIQQIAGLANDKKLEGISDLRDESDRDGMRIVIELKRDAVPAVAFNQLFKRTQMQTTFGAIMLALTDGVPKEMDLKEILQHFIDHRHEVITRRTQFEVKRAEDREHILEGLQIAVENIDEVIKIIRKSKDTPAADAALRKRFKLSEKQTAEILNMRLARLTALEITKLVEELKEVRKFIKECKEILASKPRRMKILKEELGEVGHGFGDQRRTEIVADQGEFSIEDLIAEEDMVITMSHAGYIKRLPVSAYRRQRRGGRGVTADTGRRLM